MKTRTATMECTQTLTDPVDVVLLSSRTSILPQVANMLSSRNLSYLNLHLSDFQQIKDQLDLVGTVVIDAAGLTVSQQKSLQNIIKVLDSNHISSVLLNCWLNLASESTLLGTLYSSTLEELWGRIQANIAYHKRTQELTASRPEPKPAVSDDLAQQLKMAGQVQRDFLPSVLPSGNGLRWSTIFKPADWVSGDIYDIARLDEKNIGFYVADAVGHSVPAALLTMFLKQAIVMRETTGRTYQVFDPAKVMEKLNSRMVEQKLSGCQFATCCYCLFNTETRQLKLARSGHPYPLLIRANGQIEQLQARGTLLGIFEDAEYTEQSAILNPGDKLVLYSDGAEPLIGKMDSEKGFLYEKEFLGITNQPLEKMTKSLEQMIQQKKFSAAEFDDITIIALEIA